jgi:PAS domain S-box-containing protein
MLTGATDIFAFVFFLSIGLSISLITSRVNSARNLAAQFASSLTLEQESLNTVIEIIPDIVMIYDQTGKLIQLNRIARAIMSVDRNNESLAKAQQAYNIRTPTGEPFPLDEIPIARALRGETVSGVKVCYISQTGEQLISLASAAPLYDTNGVIRRVIATAHPITDLIKAEREASARANELDAIFEAITDGLVVYDNDWRILRTNTAWRKLLGLAEDEDNDYTSLSLHERFMRTAPHLLDGQAISAEQGDHQFLHRQLFLARTPFDVQFRTMEGQERIISTGGASIRTTSGESSGAVAVLRDVTEQRKLEQRTHEALQALLAMARIVVQGPGDAPAEEHTDSSAQAIAQQLATLTQQVLGCERLSIHTIDPQTDLMQPLTTAGVAEEHREQLWTSQASGRRFSEVMSPAFAQRLRAQEAIVLDMQQSPWNQLPNPYGLWQVLMAPMYLDGALIGLLSLDYGGSQHEYTTQEIGLAQAVAQLASLVLERERLLKKWAKAQARSLALHVANEQMDDFLGIAGHELKTPLTTIKGSVQLSQRWVERLTQDTKTLSPDQVKNVQALEHMLFRANRACKVLERVIADLLDVSRIRAGVLQLLLQSHDLGELVQTVVEDQHQITPSRTIVVQKPSIPVMVIVDADRIGQVITNYLSNALKYSPAHSPVSLSLAIEGTEVRVSVHDEGSGIKAAEQKHIWERFYRVKDIEVQSGSGVGLGLGLHICITIIHQHGGLVGMESEHGVGSTFWFTLPVAQ